MAGFDFRKAQDVMTLEDVVLRPKIDRRWFAATHRFVGAVILTEGSAMIRAASRGLHLYDVDLATGETRSAIFHPGSIWINDWEIVLTRPGEEILLCRRDKPQGSPF
jgi:hypothetical protein